MNKWQKHCIKTKRPNAKVKKILTESFNIKIYSFDLTLPLHSVCCGAYLMRHTTIFNSTRRIGVTSPKGPQLLSNLKKETVESNSQSQKKTNRNVDMHRIQSLQRKYWIWNVSFKSSLIIFFDYSCGVSLKACE